MQHFTPTQLAEYLDKKESNLTLLDVREPWEFEICHIHSSILIPMGQVPDKLDILTKEHTIVVICHHGIRSRNIATFLGHKGFQHVINLTGGVEAWATEIDLNMAKY